MNNYNDEDILLEDMSIEDAILDSIENASESVIALFEALLTSNEVDLEHSARKVMEYGGTSGIEMIIGILFGTSMMLNYGLQKSDTF